MGRMTDEITRLAGEIQCSRRDRQQMMRDLRRDAVERRREVKGMQAGFRAAHAETSRRQKKALRDFAAGIEHRVSGLLKGFADDLAGARRAWGRTSSLELKSLRAGAARLERSVPETEAAGLLREAREEQAADMKRRIQEERARKRKGVPRS